MNPVVFVHPLGDLSHVRCVSCGRRVGEGISVTDALRTVRHPLLLVASLQCGCGEIHPFYCRSMLRPTPKTPAVRRHIWPMLGGGQGA